VTRRLPGGADLAFGGFVLLWVLAFGLQQLCTTDEHCTLGACPALGLAPVGRYTMGWVGVQVLGAPSEWCVDRCGRVAVDDLSDDVEVLGATGPWR